jgi:hypothetical protein
MNIADESFERSGFSAFLAKLGPAEEGGAGGLTGALVGGILDGRRKAGARARASAYGTAGRAAVTSVGLR